MIGILLKVGKYMYIMIYLETKGKLKCAHLRAKVNYANHAALDQSRLLGKYCTKSMLDNSIFQGETGEGEWYISLRPCLSII